MKSEFCYFPIDALDAELDVTPRKRLRMTPNQSRLVDPQLSGGKTSTNSSPRSLNKAITNVLSRTPSKLLENDDQKNCPVKGAEWKWWSNRRSVHLLRSFAISSAKCGWWGEDSIYLLNSTTRGGGMMRRIRRMIIVWEVEDKILISEGKAADLAEE